MPAKEYHLDKFHIISSTESIVTEILKVCKQMNDDHFYHSDGKWSNAENLEHLRLSFARSWKGLFVPKIISRIMFGKPSHQSAPYEVLQEAYKEKLSKGAKASKEYIPQVERGKSSKVELMEKFDNTARRYLDEIRYYWEETNMDLYQFPHPILGNITARELMYFNIFHCWHHFNIMRQRNSEAFEL
ncbi:MAG TPA: DinB family protein [Lacibacter sp.]|nr:DinB family protein [Lacibacter sp.]